MTDLTLESQQEDDGDVGLVKFLDTDLLTVCRGVIGKSGNKFCIKQKCRVAAHTNKVALPTNACYFIGCPRSDHAFLMPCLPLACVTTEKDKVMMETQKKPFEVWKLFFQRLKAEEADSSKSGTMKMDIDEERKVSFMEQLNEIDDARISLKTPKRVNTKGKINYSFLNDAIDTDLLRVLKKRKIDKTIFSKGNVSGDDKGASAYEHMALQWEALVTELEELQESFNTNVTSAGKFREKIIECNLFFQSEISKSADMSRLMNNELGESELKKEGNTLWGLIERIMEEQKASDIAYKLETLTDHIQILRKEVDGFKRFKLSIGTNSNDISSLMARVKGISEMAKLGEKNLGALKDHYVQNFQTFQVRLGKLSTAMGNIRGATMGARTNVYSSSEGNIAMKFSNMENEIGGLRSDLRDLKNSLRSVGNESEIERLNNRVKEIESRVSGESCNVSNGEYIFTSETDVGLWLEKEEVTSLGLFWDLFSVLVAMSPKSLTGKERADQQYSSDRIKTTTAENELAAAMAHERPHTLYGDKTGKLVALEEGFGECKTHDKWIMGSQSFKVLTTKQLKKFVKGILGNLTQSCGGRNLARILLNEVSNQWNDTVAFIDSFFQDLTETAHFPKEKAWKLVGQCCAAIFDAMEPYRAVVSQIEDLGLLSSKAKFLWCVLQCHRVMKEFISKDYRGHPQMVKQISLFMINERVDPLAFGKLEEKVKSQGEKIEELEKQIGALKRTVGNFEGMRKDISELQRQMKAKK